MRILVAFTLTFLGFVASEGTVPTFTWLNDQYSPDGVPLLAVNFHDGGSEDVALLMQFNPIPKQPKESEENIDKCIFKGYLRDESDVYVTLTGGCPFDKTFDVMLRSKRTEDYMFQVKKGQTVAVPSIFKTKGLIVDKAVRPPTSAKRSFKNPSPPPNALTLDVELNYDQSFLNKYGEDEAGNAIRRVAAQADNLFHWSSLDTQLTWRISAVYVIPDTIEASNEWLDYVGSQYNNAEVNSNVYMAYQNDAPGTAGLAWLGTICSSTNYRTAISEYFNNDLTSAEILAHEVGHNTGMDHDFNGSPGADRYDSQGNSCTDIGGVLDYFQPQVTRWTSCSNEDFNNNDYSCLS